MNDNHPAGKEAANGANAHLSAQAFDMFVGFIYAMTIALVIETAYLQSHFSSIVPSVVTLLLLSFFAYDWLSRFSPRHAMSGKINESRRVLFFRRLLEIGIVYFLLLVCLKVVEICTYKEPAQPDQVRTFIVLLYSMAAFAAASGFWNALMISGSTQVNKKHISCLFKGHLHEDIVSLFPFIKSWMDDLAQNRAAIHKEAREETIRNAQEQESNPANSGVVIEHMNHMAQLRSALGWRLFLRRAAFKPHHLLLPYFFVFHIVALNFVLGGFILSSALLARGSCLLAHSAYMRTVALVCLPLGMLLSLLFFVSYFMSERNREPWCERLGCLCLMLTILLCYSVSSAFVLMGLVIVQQVGANIIMTQYFDPSRPQPADVPGATNTTAMVGQT